MADLNKFDAVGAMTGVAIVAIVMFLLYILTDSISDQSLSSSIKDGTVDLLDVPTKRLGDLADDGNWGTSYIEELARKELDRRREENFK